MRSSILSTWENLEKVAPCNLSHGTQWARAWKIAHYSQHCLHCSLSLVRQHFFLYVLYCIGTVFGQKMHECFCKPRRFFSCCSCSCPFSSPSYICIWSILGEGVTKLPAPYRRCRVIQIWILALRPGRSPGVKSWSWINSTLCIWYVIQQRLAGNPIFYFIIILY
jgi:hypothetical protein